MATAQLRYGATTTREYTALADQKAGDVVILADNRIGVIVHDVLSGALGAVFVDGIFDITSPTAATSAAGLAAYVDIDVTNSIIAAASKATGDVLAGIMYAAKTSGQLVATVDLNAALGTVSA